MRNNDDLLYKRLLFPIGQSSKCLKIRDWLGHCKEAVCGEAFCKAVLCKGHDETSAGEKPAWSTGRSMANLDRVEAHAAGNWDGLYWWRRNGPREAQPPAPLTQRIAALAERVAPPGTVAEPPPIVESPGNSLRAAAAARRSADRAVLPRQEPRAELLVARQHERRRARRAIALSVIETAALIAASLYAAAMHEPVGLGFALAGSGAASFGLYRALCGMLPSRSGDRRNILRTSAGAPVTPATRKRKPGPRLSVLPSTARYRAPERHL